MVKQRHFLGIKVDDVTYEEALQRTARFLQSSSFHHIVTVGPEFILEARSNPRFANVLNHADMSVPDGVGLLMTGLLTGRRLHQRVTGLDLTIRLARQASENDRSLFLLGGTGNVARQAARTLQQRFPTLRIAGTATLPMFSRSSWNALDSEAELRAASERAVAVINNAKPDILLVAFGAPKQDLWIDFYRSRMPSVNIAMGVGGTFDVLAGTLRRAPRVFQKAGLEWLWRLLLQPSRIRRILNATVRFPLAVVLERRHNKAEIPRLF